MGRHRRGREEGSIYQRSDGQWTASVSLGYDANGKRKRRVVYGKTKAEVAEKLRRLQTAADSGKLPEAGAPLVKNFLPVWLGAIKPTVADYTHREYERHVRLYLIPYLGGARLVTVTALHVQKFYADMAKDGISPAMCKKAGVTLGVALQYAVETAKIIPHNPARDVKKPRHTPKEMRPLDPDEVRRFLDAAKADRLYTLYLFLLDTGAREGEAFALNWEEVEWDGRAVRIIRNLQELGDSLTVKELKTKKSRRRVALSSFTTDALAEHRKRMLAEGNYKIDGPVFCDTAGGWLRKSNLLRRSFRPILERAGLPAIRPYDLRHSSATLLLLTGEDSKVVADRLGHSTTRLTQDTYQHVLPGMQERAASKLDAILRRTDDGKDKNAV